MGTVIGYSVVPSAQMAGLSSPAVAPTIGTALTVARTLRLWHSGTGTEFSTLRGHSGAVTCCAFSPDNQTVLSGSRDTKLILWDVATGEAKCTLTGHSEL